nr:MAG TPA: hypothetical protein [Bacteriophage sp.]
MIRKRTIQKADSCLSALVGVEIKNEAVYPFERLIVMYLPDQFRDCFFIIHNKHLFSDYILPYFDIHLTKFNTVSNILEIFCTVAICILLYDKIICTPNRIDH